MLVWKSAFTPNNRHIFRLIALKIRAMLTQFLVEFMQAQYTEILHRLDRIVTQVEGLSKRVDKLERNQFHSSILTHMKNKPFLFTVVATIFFAVLAYFGFTPDLDAANALGGKAQEVANAISTRNWILAGQGIVALGAFLYAWINGDGNSEAGGR